jgi:glycine/D-amino acid oxidase-like deaminating enzyme
MIISTDRRVVVIGAGIFGASTAAQLALRGVEVTLVTEAEPASGASGRSLGWLNAFGDQPDAYIELRLRAIECYRRYVDDHRQCDFIRFPGGIWWGDDDAHTEAEFHRLSARNYPVACLTRDEAVAKLPGLSPDGLPDLVVNEPDEGWVELADLVPELIRQFTSAGGTLITNAGRCDVELTDGRVTGVTTAARGRLDADVAVVSAGASVPSVAGDVTALPDKTPVALLVRTKPVTTPLRAVVNSPRVAIRPTPNGGLVVDHDWAARSVVQAADGSYSAPPEVVDELLGEASAVLAGHPKLTVERLGIGLKPVPADGLPVIGAVPDVDGYYLAFSHSGATLGLIIGALLADEILDGSTSPLLAPFRPGRFARLTD